MEFKPFPKLSRWSRNIVITEKIDGTNASILVQSLPLIGSDFDPEFDCLVADRWAIRAGSRTRWVNPGDDNYGFAAWVRDLAEELVDLGEGHHFGEWWGRGIQRNYSQPGRRFSLFNAGRWAPHDGCVPDGQERPPECCDVVPVLYRGPNEQAQIAKTLRQLADLGSVAAPGFMKPEGIVIFHTASGESFKKTIEKDESPKGVA